jgi:TRAP-type mannitol/chloroaromatic compound transport system substrate-binding protein
MHYHSLPEKPEDTMKRRQLIKGLGAGAVLAGLSGCGQKQAATVCSGAQQVYRWKMVTTWPPNFPGAGIGASNLAKRIEVASNGRIRIQVYGAGELVPAFEAFDVVSSGTVQMAHGASYYWKGKAEATQFFTAVPFGMTAQEMNAWLYYGGGLELWQELYAPFNVVPVPGGNTGTQMAGWFNKEINSVDDLKGLKMRIPGLGAEVLKRAGGTPVNVPGAEIFTALQTGIIDAAEWIGPYNDLALGLYKAASHYYYPGWHEPCATLEAIFNKEEYDALPADLQAIVMLACQASNDDMLADYTAQNQRALRVLAREHGIVPKPLPDAVLLRLKQLADEVLHDLAAGDEMVARVYSSYHEFQKNTSRWLEISEKAYFDARLLGRTD